MILFELKDYQKRAAEELLNETSTVLSKPKNDVRKFVLESPTGSGKTVMMAAYMRDLVDKFTNIAFIWFAPHTLHIQSKESLEEKLADIRQISCRYWDDLNDNMLNSGDILFINWANLNKDINRIIRENEQGKNFENVMSNTRENGRKIVLVIDESHFGAGTNIAEQIYDTIKPNIIINVSATPKTIGVGIKRVSVEQQEVADEGMIKKDIQYNMDLDDKKPEKFGISDVIEKALNKRKELKEIFEQLDDVDSSKINPLVLIQSPTKSNLIKEDYVTEITRILKIDHGITTDNQRFAIWLSDKKINTDKDLLIDNDGPVEVLLFKQAIALGWDCPRAQILASFREWHDKTTLPIQTLGRIMRMPERKHYENDELNRAYVYSNVNDIQKEKPAYSERFFTKTIKRKKQFETVNLVLPAHYKKPDRHKEILDQKKYYEYFINQIEKNGIKDIISKGESNPSNPKKEVIKGKIEKLDQGNMSNAVGIDVLVDDEDITKEFDSELEKIAVKFDTHSVIAKIKQSLYQYAHDIGYDKNDDYEDKLQKILLDDKNKPTFQATIQESLEDYLDEHSQAQVNKPISFDWNFPSKIRVTLDSKAIPVSLDKYLMEKLEESSKPPSTEIGFMNYLNNQCSGVKWWYKNGSANSRENFAVKYTEPLEDDSKGVKENCFYVDFIVCCKDGSIGLFDTKGGIHIEVGNTKHKSDGLQKYIQEMNKSYKDNDLLSGGKRVRFWGGIVKKEGEIWKYNPSKKYHYEKGWESLLICEKPS